MTPDARAAMLGSDVETVSSIAMLGDRNEARVMARVRRAGRNLSSALDKDTVLGAAAKESLRHDIHWQGALYARCWQILGSDGPWLIPGETGFSRSDDRATAHLALLKRIRTVYADHLHFLGPGTAFSRSVLRLTAGLVSGLRSGGTAFVTHGWEYGMPALAARSRAALGARIACVRGARGHVEDLGAALKAVWGAIMERDAPIVVPAKPKPAVEHAALGALGKIDDPVILRGIDLFGDLLAREAALADALVPEMERVLRRLRPAALLAYSMRWGGDAALTEGAGKAGIVKVLISHGSHTPLDGALGKFVEQELASGILISPFADLCVVQSPLADAVAMDRAPQARRLRAHPTLWGYRKLPKRQGRGRRRILHAGTFKPMSMPRPWLYETPDEYIKGVASLIRAVKEMPDTELVVRLRDLPECGLEALEKLLPKAVNCRLRTGGTFLDDLAEVDLLVSYCSTTLEEALCAGRPVLLWGGTPRYRHLPARETLAMANDRAAVYRVEDESMLRPMLESVLAAHDGVPLSEAELAPYVWPEGTASAEDILSDLLKAKSLPTANAPRTGNSNQAGHAAAGN
jgi:hypothetical protein